MSVFLLKFFSIISLFLLQSPIVEAVVKHELPEAEPQVAPEPVIEKPVDPEQQRRQSTFSIVQTQTR